MQNSSSNSDDYLLDEDITIVPSTLSPTTFSSQVSQRLGIRSFSMRRADAASTTNNKSIDHLSVDQYIQSTSMDRDGT